MEYCGTALYKNGECTKLHDGSTYWDVEPPEESKIADIGSSYFSMNLDMERKQSQFTVDTIGEDFVVVTVLPESDEADVA